MKPSERTLEDRLAEAAELRKKMAAGIKLTNAECGKLGYVRSISHTAPRFPHRHSQGHRFAPAYKLTPFGRAQRKAHMLRIRQLRTRVNTQLFSKPLR